MKGRDCHAGTRYRFEPSRSLLYGKAWGRVDAAWRFGCDFDAGLVVVLLQCPLPGNRVSSLCQIPVGFRSEEHHVFPPLHLLVNGHLWDDVGTATAGRPLPEPGIPCFMLNIWSPAGRRNLLVRFEQNSASRGLRAGGEIVLD